LWIGFLWAREPRVAAQYQTSWPRLLPLLLLLGGGRELKSWVVLRRGCLAFSLLSGAGPRQSWPEEPWSWLSLQKLREAWLWLEGFAVLPWGALPGLSCGSGSSDGTSLSCARRRLSG
jgi:hypothetical protein